MLTKEEKVNLSVYKLMVVAEVLDFLEEAKEASKFPSGKFIVKAVKRKKGKDSKVRNAFFELLVDRYVDIEKLINSLEEPYRTIIKERLFLKETDYVKRKLRLSRKREAETYVRRAVNKFYNLLEKYKKGKL